MYWGAIYLHGVSELVKMKGEKKFDAYWKKKEIGFITIEREVFGEI